MCGTANVRCDELADSLEIPRKEHIGPHLRSVQHLSLANVCDTGQNNSLVAFGPGFERSVQWPGILLAENAV